MKKALFFTFLAVFAATAAITLLGITGVVTIEENYLSKLFYSLIVEAIGPVIILFRRADFFSESNTKRLIVYLEPKDSFGRSGDPYQCIVAIYNMNRDSERERKIKPKRTNGRLVLYLEDIADKEMIKVRVVNSKEELWESEYFNPNETNADMERL